MSNNSPTVIVLMTAYNRKKHELSLLSFKYTQRKVKI